MENEPEISIISRVALTTCMKVISLTCCLLLRVFFSLFDAIKPISFTVLTHRRLHLQPGAHALQGWLLRGTAFSSVAAEEPADSPPISAPVARRERDPALFVDMLSPA